MDRSELTQINLLPMVRQDLKKTPNKQKTLKFCLIFSANFDEQKCIHLL